MSRRPSHPFFVVRGPDGGCGHQHARLTSAENCARASAHIYERNTGTTPKFAVVEVTRKGDSVGEHSVTTIGGER